MSKAPKKKESKERVTSAFPASQRYVAEPSAAGNIGTIQEEKTKKSRSTTSVWPEWSEQDIASEKWDAGHKLKTDMKNKSPSAPPHFFEDPEGKIDLPLSLRQHVCCWKRPIEFIDNAKTPTVVESESLKEKSVDLLSSNEHIASSEIVRWLISNITSLTKIFENNECDISAQILKTKPSKDIKDPKTEKVKKEADHVDDSLVWKPWHHIWPKDSSRGQLTPLCNQSGKYCVKLFWMGCWRKVTIDDLMPVDAEGRVLFPRTNRNNEIWSLLLCKALMKVASLDFNSGTTTCDFGDWSVITCLTGWIPEPIPLKHGNKREIWKLLFTVLPKWRIAAPCPPASDVNKQNGDVKTSFDAHVTPKADASKVEVKESKDLKDNKLKKEDKDKNKSHEDKKLKDRGTDKGDKDSKAKDKGILLGTLHNQAPASDPEFVLFASYSSIPKTPLKITTLREMADASETLRLSGLSHNHTHSVLLTTVRNCPLVAPPTPTPIPRWRLIRQKKKRQPIESDPQPMEPPKDPEFIQVFSPFVNYCVSPVPVSRAPSPVKWDKFKPQTPMEIVDEENIIQDGTFRRESSDSISVSKMEETSVDSKSQTETGSIKPVRVSSKGNFSVNDEVISTKAGNTNKRHSDAGSNPLADLEDGATKDKTYNRATPSTSEKTSADTQTKQRKSSRAPDAKSFEVKRVLTKDKDSKEHLFESPATPGGSEQLREDETQKDNGDKDDDNDNVEEDDVSEVKNKAEAEFWIDYEDFTKCFSTLWIFHKPSTYTFNKSHTEIKGMEAKVEKGRKGGALNTAMSAVAPTPVNRGQANTSPSIYGSHQPHTDPPPPYLLVDSLTNIEITVGFTSFSKWFDQTEITKPSRSKEKDIEPEKEAGQATPLVPGVIIAEPFSWKNLVAGQPSLCIRTTGIKTAVFSLPAGRHVLRLMVQAPLGYHIDICSQTPFIFGDEDSIMQYLINESCRFVHHAVSSIQEIGKVIKMFREAPLEVEKKIDLQLPSIQGSLKGNHLNEFFYSLFLFAKTAFGESIPPSLTFAMEALKLKTILHLKKIISKKQVQRYRSDSNISKRSAFERDNLRHNSLQETMPIIDLQDASFAATKIQAYFRGFYVRKLTKSFEYGSEENKLVEDVISKLWSLISATIESNAVKVYRMMFDLYPPLYPLFPFYKDEWTRVAYADYHGSYNEQISQAWFVVFREVFYVQKPVLVAPKLSINIPSCVLRVIDNDTKQDLPRVFMKVAPQQLEVNKGGYTFMAEAHSSDNVVPPGKFRLRLIGSSDPLPAPAKESHVNTSFVTKEIRDYYIPNRHSIIMRYTVKVVADQLTSIQFATSKSDVYINLQVLDHENELISVLGKGHAVIPALTFLKDRVNESDEEKSSRKGSRQSSRKSSPKTPRAAKRGSLSRMSPLGKQIAKSDESGLDRSTSEELFTNALDSPELLAMDGEEKILTHKYIIQATVERNSWPLSKNQWHFVSTLKNMDKTEGEAEQSKPEKEKHSAGTKGKKGSKKDTDGRASKNLNASSRPESQNIDPVKPNWVLRIVTDGNSGEISVVRDTERAEQIKAMKAAWEAAEPGRAAKALQARMKFLNENTIKVEKAKATENEEIDEEAVSIPVENSDNTLSPPSPGLTEKDSGELTLIPPPVEKERVLKPFDFSPYIRTLGQTILLDESEEERLHEEHEKQQRRFLVYREEVLRRREEDLNQRNAQKEIQIQLYEDVQAKVDAIREAHQSLREKYCQKFVEQPPAQLPAETENDKKRKTPSPTRGKKTPSPNRGRRTPKGKTSKSPAKGKKK